MAVRTQSYKNLNKWLWGSSKLITYLLPLIAAHSTWAAIIGPDTLNVNEDTFYKYGYDYPSKARMRKGYATTTYGHFTPKQLEALAGLEWEIYHDVSRIYSNLRGAIPSGDKFSSNVHEYLQDFEATSLKLVNHMKNSRENISIGYILTTNLLTPFLTARRFRNYIWPWMEKTSNNTVLQDSIVRYIRSVYKPKDGPVRMDFHYSMLSIIMPHFILDLKAQDIASGFIRGKKIGVKLKACHCLDIGVHGVASGIYPVGIEWLELTIEKINNGDDSVDLELAKNWLEVANAKHDEIWVPGLLEYSSDGSQIFEKPLKITKRFEDRKWQKQKICEDKENLPHVLSKENRLPDHLHWSVCKGDMSQSSAEKSKLFCWYERKVNAMFQIGPLKMELLSTFPLLELVQFHDLISNESFSNAIKSAHDVIPSSLDNDLPQPKMNYGVINVVQNPEVLRKFEILAERVTGLVTKDPSPSYATRYVPGGFACTHEDWKGFDDRDLRKSVRVATFLLYIEQPEQGGETTFPLSLVRATPLKGSAIFSYNLLKSGERDKYAPHASCPVTFGRKLVVSKDWLYVDQTQWTCSKDRDARHEILVNGQSKYSHKILQELY